MAEFKQNPQCALERLSGCQSRTWAGGESRVQALGQLLRTSVLLGSSAEYLDPRKSLPRHTFLEATPPHAHTPHMRNTPLSPLCEASCTLLSLGLPPLALQLLSQLPPHPPPQPPPQLTPAQHHPVLPARAQFSRDSSVCLLCHGIPRLLARCLAHSRYFVFT